MAGMFLKEGGMNQLMRHGQMFLENDEAAAGMEAGVLVALVAMVIIGTTTEVGMALTNTFASIGEALATTLPWR